jgi:hypothetical protein
MQLPLFIGRGGYHVAAIKNAARSDGGIPILVITGRKGGSDRQGYTGGKVIDCRDSDSYGSIQNNIAANSQVVEILVQGQ